MARITLPVVEVQNLVKEYGGRRPVLDGITFSVDETDFVMVHGKSGCGKTTLLNILGGLDRPTSGDVRIDGQSIVDITEDELALIRLQKIGFVFQDFNLLLDLSVNENVALPLRFSGKKDRGRVRDMLEKFDIGHIADESANRISGGEAQRVAIARALMNEPKIVLADEPTGNLDLENTKKVMEAFRMATEDLGTTVVLATHDQDLARYCSSKIHIINGRLLTNDLTELE